MLSTYSADSLSSGADEEVRKAGIAMGVCKTLIDTCLRLRGRSNMRKCVWLHLFAEPVRDHRAVVRARRPLHLRAVAAAVRTGRKPFIQRMHTQQRIESPECQMLFS